MDLTRIYCPWMDKATAYVGQSEIPGPRTAGFIAGMLKGLHAWWGDDETPWCGVYVASCIQQAGLPIAKEWWRAKGWLDFGMPIPLDTPTHLIPYGTLVVLNRPPKAANGHVGFFARRAELSTGKAISLLGGNQGNSVRYSTFPVERVAYMCWPGPPLPAAVGTLLVAMANGQRILSKPTTGEA